MKRLIGIIVLIVGVMSYELRGAEGSFCYEVAVTSIISFNVTVTTHTNVPQMVTRSTITADRTVGGTGVSWYSYTIQNVSETSATYKFEGWGASTTTLTCSNSMMIGTGTPAAPTSVTENVLMRQLWMLGCAGSSGSSDIRIIQRGR